MDILIQLAILVVAFGVLMKSAHLFVDGAVGIAKALKIPKLIVGIVLVSFATTAPELTVSVLAAFRGNSEIALGNAVGSVICDDTLAMGFAGILAVVPIAIQPAVLRTTGLFIIAVDLLAFGLILNGTLSRAEGILMLGLLVGYLVFIVLDTKKGRVARRQVAQLEEEEENRALEEMGKKKEDVPSPGRSSVQFIVGVTGVVIASHFVVESAIALAGLLGVPEVIIGLTAVAFGTSLPEIVTCVVSVRKGQGHIAVGNVLGADIFNILWIAGMSATVNPIAVTKKQLYFMFPTMMVVVLVMLGLMRIGHNLNRGKGIFLVLLYAVYLVLTVIFFMPA